MSYLSDFKEFDKGYVAFGGRAKGGKINGKGTLKTSKLDFEDVYFVKELQFNLFTDKSHVLLKVPRKNNIYSVDIKNIVPRESLTCLVAKATLDESMLWHRRLGHGKQYKASYKSKIQNSITQPLFMLHMDLFGPTFVSNLMNKKYCLVVTDDYSRFTWVSFLASKDETSGILKSFITEIENLVDKKAARTMLADSKLPTTFWAEAVNTARYVQNRVLVVKPHNKTPYELFRGKTPTLSFMRPFGCHVIILNTLDYLVKFDGKLDERFFVGYSLNIKAFRVYNIRTRKVEENLHIRFMKDKPIIAGDRPKWLFDIDVLTKSMNYVPVVAGTNSNDFVDGSLFDSSSKNASNDEPQPSSDVEKKDDEGVSKASGIDNQERPENSTQDVNTAGPSINTVSTNINTGSLNINIVSPIVTTTSLEATHVDFFGDETELDMSNITTTYLVPSTPNTRIHKDHSLDHVIGDVQSVEPKKLIQALTDSSWIEAMQDELLQNKKDERGYAYSRDFVMYQMDVKSAFLYGKIKEEVYVCQPPGFEDPEFRNRVYKTAVTPMETSKPLHKDAEAEDVDVHLYRSMIGSECQPKLGIWYPKDSPFDLEAYIDSDYAGASLDSKYTTGGCQFLKSRLISWQYKKQTIVTNSTTEAEYVAASSCCGQVLWTQNQMLDYGYNFMNTKIFIDNESTICIVKNLLFHSKTKNIEIRHHFIRDSNEKKLIQMIKIHIDHNVTDLLTKAFDVGRFQYLIASIGILNP
ncbi:putative ribonuclease H-like domain-containing protein [Tanacetum coccineum]